MQEMTQKDMVVGNKVAPLPDYVNTDWARGKKWPKEITEVVNDYSFTLKGTLGIWSTCGLYVVDNSIRENE